MPYRLELTDAEYVALLDLAQRDLPMTAYADWPPREKTEPAASEATLARRALCKRLVAQETAVPVAEVGAELIAAECLRIRHAAAPGAHCLDELSWPWGRSWWKPAGTDVGDLVKAGALIAAEIDRLQRAASTTKGDGDGD